MLSSISLIKSSILSDLSIFSYSILIKFSFCTLSTLLKLNLSIKRLNFSFLNFSKTASLSHSSTLIFSNFFSIGASISIVPRVLERKAFSLSFSNFSFNLPFMFSIFS